MRRLTVRVGNVLDTQTGIVYSSRSACIEALGRDVAVPMLRDRRFKRLRVITVEEKKKAMYKKGEHACAMAVVFLEGTVRDIEIAARGGYSHDDFIDVVSSLTTLREDLDNFISNIDEAGHYLGDKIDQETMRHEFQIDRADDIRSMVQLL